MLRAGRVAARGIGERTAARSPHNPQEVFRTLFSTPWASSVLLGHLFLLPPLHLGKRVREMRRVREVKFRVRIKPSRFPEIRSSRRDETLCTLCMPGGVRKQTGSSTGARVPVCDVERAVARRHCRSSYSTRAAANVHLTWKSECCTVRPGLTLCHCFRRPPNVAVARGGRPAHTRHGDEVGLLADHEARAMFYLLAAGTPSGYAACVSAPRAAHRMEADAPPHRAGFVSILGVPNVASRR